MQGRVLIVDDDSHLLSALVRQLGPDLDLATAQSGGQALDMVGTAQAQGRPFAVVVSDMRMPGMDGIETLMAVRERAPDTVRIILTGNGDQHTAIDAINDGAIFRFYTKPCPTAVLKDGIEAGIRQYAMTQAEHRLAESEERWRVALAAVGDGAWDWNPSTGQLICSEGWARMLGAPQGWTPATESEWWALLHPDDAARTSADIDHLLAGLRSPLSIEHRMRCQDGGYRWFLTRGIVFARNGGGDPVRVVGTCADITERRALEDSLSRSADELRRLATTDSLTGLWNRRSFLEKAEEELARTRRYDRSMSILMVDIDFFKRVNDTHGHEAGDRVLARFAEIIRSQLRKTDFVGRIGGEEFAIVLPETDGASAAVAAETLRAAVEATPIELASGAKLSITASFGVAMATRRTPALADALRWADEAMYQAKHDGRNKVVCRTGPDSRHAG